MDRKETVLSAEQDELTIELLSDKIDEATQCARNEKNQVENKTGQTETDDKQHGGT